MNVLFMTRDLREIGGTQTWTQTLAKAAMDKGHNVSAWSFMTGLDMPCPTYTELSATEYDVIIINHNTCVGFSHFKRLEGTRVFTSHGPLHPLERTCGGADHYVGVSEEVVMVQAEQGYLADVIRQPIDLDKFKYTDNQRNGKVLIMPKRTDAMRTAAHACQRAGIDFDIAHYRENPVDEIWKLLPEYSYVITAGRGVVEAMACGVQVLSYNGDHHSDGWITPENVGHSAQNNYSGRATSLNLDADGLADMLRNCPDNDQEPLVAWVREHHDAKNVVDKYLSYANVASGQNTLHTIYKDTSHGETSDQKELPRTYGLASA